MGFHDEAEIDHDGQPHCRPTARTNTRSAIGPPRAVMDWIEKGPQCRGRDDQLDCQETDDHDATAGVRACLLDVRTRFGTSVTAAMWPPAVC